MLLPGRMVGVLVVPGAAFHVITPRSVLILLFSTFAVVDVIVGGPGFSIWTLPLGSFLHSGLLHQTRNSSRRMECNEEEEGGGGSLPRGGIVRGGGAVGLGNDRPPC